MAPPRKYVTEKAMVPEAAPAPVTAQPAADPFAPGARAYIVDSAGLPSAGAKPRQTSTPLVTNDARFRVDGHTKFYPRASNLPIESERSIALRKASDEAVAKTAAARKAAGHFGRGSNRWVKLGLQPGEHGYTLYVETFEGDKRVKETVRRGLSPMGAREQLALHLSSLWAGF